MNMDFQYGRKNFKLGKDFVYDLTYVLRTTVVLQNAVCMLAGIECNKDE